MYNIMNNYNIHFGSFYFVLLPGLTWTCSGVIFSALKNYSWLAQGNYMGCQRYYPHWLCARIMSYSLYIMVYSESLYMTVIDFYRRKSFLILLKYKNTCEFVTCRHTYLINWTENKYGITCIIYRWLF